MYAAAGTIMESTIEGGTKSGPVVELRPIIMIGTMPRLGTRMEAPLEIVVVLMVVGTVAVAVVVVVAVVVRSVGKKGLKPMNSTGE